MAKLVGVINTSHQWIDRPAEFWDAIRQNRQLRADVPTDSLEERVAKAERVARAKQVLKDKMAELRPDVLVVVSGDQNENFPAPEFRVVPMITVFAGEDFSGFRYERGEAQMAKAFGWPSPPAQSSTKEIEEQQVVNGHPELAKALLYGLVEEGFDPGFSLNLPNPERGLGHGWMYPLGYFTDYSIPAVPIVLNTIYAPCLTGRRSIQLGHALRKIVDQYPEDLRVVALSSGGLWHTPGEPEAWLDEEFDQANMNYLSTGDVAGWARNFDDYDSEGDPSQPTDVASTGASGLPAMPGPQGGTREELNWVVASAMAEGSPFTIVDMVNIYSSPINCAFAYCDSVK
jgi:hypothetical protein